MPMKPDTSPNIVVDKEELRNRLTPMEYQITQEKGTERYDVQNECACLNFSCFRVIGLTDRS